MTVPKLIDVKNLEELKLWADKVFEALQGTTSTSTGSSGVINSIQRGTIVVANGTSSNTATITSVDVTKSELRDLGQTTTSGSDVDTVYIVLTNATTITATRAGTSGITTISWELTEYV